MENSIALMIATKLFVALLSFWIPWIAAWWIKRLILD